MQKKLASRVAFGAAAGVTGLIGVVAIGHQAVVAKTSPTYHVPSKPTTMYRGYFPRDAPPVLTVPSGAIVSVDTISHQNIQQTGVPAKDVLADAIPVFQQVVAPVSGLGAHYMTGPIYIQGAEPGDTLEVRILDVKPRVPWGTAPGSKRVYIEKGRALFAPGIEIPLKPFQGIMAVAAADDFVSPITAAANAGLVSSRPPGPFGGNMDTNDLGIGTSLYLPVFRSGAQFFTGDPHEVQGNGEVAGSALEQSNTATFQFIVHKGGGLTGPQAETPLHYITMGIDVDLDVAMRNALRNALDFLQAEKGFTPSEAMSFASLAIDMNISETVNFTQLVMARIPKRFFVSDFKKKPDFWKKPLKDNSEGQRQGLDQLP
ncbi:MAG: acetamidase/formamidase family protein [bacterium]|nr:acetamidase/formamidase family protein [bacterium]